MILNTFLFFDENDTATESDALDCSAAKQLTLTVEPGTGATINLTVSGKADLGSDEWHELGAISLIDYEPVNPITDGGAYTFVINGINKVKVTNNGTAGNCLVFGTLSN